MGRSEEYLDSLLDSLSEPNDSENSELDISSLLDEIEPEEVIEEVAEAPKKRTPETEASYLDAFEKELAEEIGDNASDFLREFEADIGIESEEESEEPEVSSDLDISNILDSIDTESSMEPEVSSEPSEPSEPSGSDVSESVSVTESPSESNQENQDNQENQEDKDNQENQEDEDFISDIDDEVPKDEFSNEPVSETSEPADSEGEKEGGNEKEGSEDISGDEILNIGDLLDSIDEEGNLSEAEKEVTPGDAVDEDADSSEGAEPGEEAPKKEDKPSDSKEEEGKEKKKPGFLAKLIAILFSTGEEKEDKEGEEQSEEAPSEAIDEEPPIDKKQAKKEEKERKKKEKEEAKKKAKEEKDKKAKEKPPKAPKQKKPKVPDKSPKIPLIAILAFLLLSASMVVLWFVAQKTISHALFINSAKSSFDHQEYMDSYQKLSGLTEYNDDDLLLYSRAKVMAMLEYRIKAYDVYVEREEHINALDALVRGSVYYNAHKREASELGIPSEYEDLGRTINDRLSTIYGLSEQDAKDLMALRERKNYTRELYRILERQGLWSYEKR